MKFPKTIRVRQYDVAVSLVPGLHHYGTFIYAALQIQVRAELTPQLMADTLMHELLHVMNFAAGGKRKLTEEQIARLYAGSLTQLMRDNPELMRWFQKAVA